MAVAAAAALARSDRKPDVDRAFASFQHLIDDARDAAAEGRREAARALARIGNPRFRVLLVPLLYDPHVEVVREAIRSARTLGASDGLFLPGLLSGLAHRSLKQVAREALAACGGENRPGPSATRSRTRTSTSGCGGTFRRPWPCCPCSRPWTRWRAALTPRTGSCATRSSRPSNG